MSQAPVIVVGAGGHAAVVADALLAAGLVVIAPFAPERPSRLKALARVKPSETEVRANPRSRSAIMRVAERTEVQR